MPEFTTEGRWVLSKLFGQKPVDVPVEVDPVPAPPPPGPDRAELLAAEEARLAAAIASGDETLIAPFALSASSTKLRQRAAEAIEDPERIRELIRAARGGKDNAVHRILAAKRDARLEAERAAAQWLAQLEATATTIARHARLPYDPLYEATLQEHERRWRPFAAHATAEQQASVEVSLAASREVVAAHHAAIEAAVESRRAAEEAAHRELAEREALAAVEAARSAWEHEAIEVEQAAREAQAAIDAEASRKALGLLRQAQAALERGSTAHAERLRAALGRKLQAGPASAITPGFQRQLDLVDEKLRELRDWHAFTAAPKRTALIERMRSLVGASIAPPQLAQHIRKLQQEWRTLNTGIAEEGTAEHQQFRELANKAYEPCAAHFAAQSAQRTANREQRESILARLAAFTSSLDAAAETDWRLVATVLSEARREWQKFAPVDQDIAVALQARFRAALDELGGRLDAEYQRNIAARGELIARAAALVALPDVRTAIEGAKQLQRDWTATGIVPHAKGNALWEEFRGHCNAVFERSAQEFAAQAAALGSNVERAGTLAGNLERIASLEGDALREGFKGVDAIIVEFEALELPPTQARGLTGRFQQALGRCAQLRDQDRAQAAQRAANGLFDAAAAVRAYAMLRADGAAEEALAAQGAVVAAALAGLESAPRAARLGLERHWSKLATAAVPFDLAANALALRLLCVRAEIATGRETPAEDQGLRREHQLRRLVASRTLGAGAGPEDLAALSLEWLTTGPAAPEIELALRARFSRCAANPTR
jgi:hypothetical protein